MNTKVFFLFQFFIDTKKGNLYTLTGLAFNQGVACIIERASLLHLLTTNSQARLTGLQEALTVFDPGPKSRRTSTRYDSS
ncbi:hypothetical protein FNU33_22300 [Salmonella enterica]|nr:hypothetical protein [Salmonella enterica]ELG0460752.1 hypothetical protein [Salmonella enterica]ELM2684148.1 hypothetical protein [Salmonella enterica]